MCSWKKILSNVRDGLFILWESWYILKMHFVSIDFSMNLRLVLGIVFPLFCLVLTSCGAAPASTSSGELLNTNTSKGITTAQNPLTWGRYQEYTKENFEKALSTPGKKILLYSYAPSCVECRTSTRGIIKAFQTSPVHAAGFRMQNGIDKETAKKYAVETVGTLVILQDGKEVGRKNGEFSEKDVLEFLK